MKLSSREQQIKALRQAGFTYAKIAMSFGISRGRVGQLLIRIEQKERIIARQVIRRYVKPVRGRTVIEDEDARLFPPDFVRSFMDVPTDSQNSPAP